MRVQGPISRQEVTLGVVTRVRNQAGLTLIELLVVMLVIAILAGIAVPVFLSQREKGWVASVRSALKNASVTAFAFGVGAGGDYSGLDNNGATKLRETGYRDSKDVLLAVGANQDSYCLLAVHELLSPDDPWRVATFDSGAGTPSSSDSCGGPPDITPELPAGVVAVPEASEPPAPVVVPSAEPTESSAPQPGPAESSAAPQPSSSATPEPTPLVTLPPLLPPLPALPVGGLL